MLFSSLIPMAFVPTAQRFKERETRRPAVLRASVKYSSAVMPTVSCNDSRDSNMAAGNEAMGMSAPCKWSSRRRGLRNFENKDSCVSKRNSSFGDPQ